MTYDELRKQISDILPNAEFIFDDAGQIIILTGKMSPKYIEVVNDEELKDIR